MKKNSKRSFGLSKRIIALAVCFAALAQGTVFAASSTYSRTAGRGKKIIEEEAAIDFACGDLGINTEEADVRSAEVVLEDGQYVYKICLYYDGTEYNYYVRVFDGDVVKVTTPSLTEKTEAPAEEEAKADESSNSLIDLSTLEDEAEAGSEESSHRTAGTGKIISKMEAIDYACGDIGVNAEDADIKSVGIVFDGGQYVYQVCFVYDGTEYTYNIRVYNGAVIKRTYAAVN